MTMKPITTSYRRGLSPSTKARPIPPRLTISPPEEGLNVGEDNFGRRCQGNFRAYGCLVFIVARLFYLLSAVLRLLMFDVY